MIGGFHINSNIRYIENEIKRASAYNANLIQLFIYSSYDKQNYKNIRNSLKKYNILSVVHAPYTINIAADWDEYSCSINNLIDQIELASYIGSFGVVVHFGKQMKLSKQRAMNNMYSSLLYVHNKTKKYNVKIILETTAGQGSEMCYLLEDLAYFFNKFSKHRNHEIKNRFRLCVDTCHIFAAGYDIKTKKNIDIYLSNFENLIGLNNIALIHLNDSKKDLGSRVDRHESLGKGYIGEKGLKYFIDIFKKNNTPIVLETPGIYHKQEMIDYLLS